MQLLPKALQTKFNLEATSTRRHRAPKEKLLVLGQGDAQRRYLPAIRTLQEQGICSEVYYAGTEPGFRLSGRINGYFHYTAGEPLPIEKMMAAGLDENTLGILATPSHSHIQMARELSGFMDTLIEKPVGTSSSEARLLLRGDVSSLNCLVHKCFAAEFQKALAHYWSNPRKLDRVSTIIGTFYETEGFSPSRIAESTIWDCQPQLLGCMVALLKAGGLAFVLEVEAVSAAQHERDTQNRWRQPDYPTASTICGRVLRLNAPPIQFQFKQVKCAPSQEKSLALLDSQGRQVESIDLSESGWLPHYRALRAEMKGDSRRPLTIDDAIGMVEVLDQATGQAQASPSYQVGSWPSFVLMEDDNDPNSRLSTANEVTDLYSTSVLR